MDVTDVIGKMPYRMAFAGGWIDQPFVSQAQSRTPRLDGGRRAGADLPLHGALRHGHQHAQGRRCGSGAARLPAGDPAELVRELYAEENRDKPEPSGSQDMIGLIYPGVNRLDYDFNHEGGYFPAHVESNNDPGVAHWLEDVIYMVPVAQRPAGYSPLGEKNLDPEWIQRLGQSGKDCFDAILTKDLRGLGASMNECMQCWEAILPNTVRHPTITVDLMGILGLLPGPLRRRHVLRLRRRLSLRRLRGTGAGRVPGEGQDQG